MGKKLSSILSCVALRRLNTQQRLLAALPSKVTFTLISKLLLAVSSDQAGHPHWKIIIS